jgi:glycosyltransferase involved in cell wall biosynthesis
MQDAGKKKFNILHVVSRLPVGGVENMLFKVVEGYSEEKFNPIVCCIKEGGAIAEKLRESGYKVILLNRMRGHGFDLGAVREIVRVIKKEEIHILRTHQYHASLYGRIAGVIAGVPVIVPSFHSFYRSPKNPKLHRRLFNHFLSCFSDRLVAVSNTVASDMVRFDWVNPKKIEIINNGIPIDRFDIDISKEEARERLNIPSYPVVIGTVGRLKEEKGHRFLVEAASHLKGVLVAIAGDGQMRDELKRLSKRLRTDCIFMGELAPEEIPIFLKTLDIFCFPSLWEGFSTALIEAMASGLPVIASDIPSHREVLDNSGILVPLKDADKIALAIKTLIDNPLKCTVLGKEAKKRARLFSIDRTIKAYEALFENVLRKKGLL